MGCPACSRSDVGEIRFSSVGEGVVFRFCRVCEHRWWESPAGSVLEIDSVLEAASVFAKSA